MKPGDAAGDCPRCGESMEAIGSDYHVLGAVCEDCQLVVTMRRYEAMSLADCHDSVRGA